MTEQEILQQIDELQAKLEALRAGNIENGKLLHDFFCTNADDMHYKELADKIAA